MTAGEVRIRRLLDQCVAWEDATGHHAGVVAATYPLNGVVRVDADRFVRAERVRLVPGISA